VLSLGGPASGQWNQSKLGPPPFSAAWRHAVFAHPSLLKRYNRVDGLVQSLEIRARAPFDFNQAPLLEAFGRVDVHADTLPEYQVRGGTLGIGVNHPHSRLGKENGIWAHADAEYRKETASPDDEIVGSAENTLAALIAKYDYKNYYLREGVSISASILWIPRRQTEALMLLLAWENDRHSSLDVVADWGLLPTESHFRPNIDAAAGRQKALRLTAGIQLQDSPRHPHSVFQTVLHWEKAGGSLGGDFTYDGVFAMLRLERSTWGVQRLTLRSGAGARSGHLALQHVLRLGGISTLRGLPHQSLTGTRLWLFNGEYRFGRDFLTAATFFPFNSGLARRIVPALDAGLLYDLGAAYEVPASDGVFRGWLKGAGIDNWGLFLDVGNDLLRIEWTSTRLLGNDYPDLWHLRLGWTL